MKRLYSIIILSLIIITVSCQNNLHSDKPKFSQILELVEKGEYSTATKQIEQILPEKNDSLQYQMYFVLGECYRKMEQWDKAAKSYQQSVNPTNEVSDYAAYHVAQCYEKLSLDSSEEKENYQNAIYWYEKLIKEYPSSFNLYSAMYYLSKCYLKAEKYREALVINDQLIKEQAKGYVRLATFNSAKAYEGLNQWGKAKLYYQKVIDAKNSDYLARDALSAIQRIVDEHKELKITRSHCFTHGMVMYSAGKHESARELFRKARLNYKDNIAVKSAYYIAKSYYRQRKYTSAIKEYQKVAKNYPNSLYYTTSLYNIPGCYRRKGYYDKAVSLYRDFYEKYSWSKYADNALYESANILKNQEKYISAIDIYALLIRNYTKSGLVDDALWWKGWCQFNLKKYPESMDTFKLLASRFPSSKYAGQAEYWIGKNYEAMEQWKNAVISYKSVIKKNYWYYSSRAEERIQSLIENQKISKGLLREQNVIPHRRIRLSADGDYWDNIPKFVTSKVELLMKLKAFEDAIVELEGIRKQKNINRQSIYYNLVLCNQKIGEYRKAYSYGYTLSQIVPNGTSDRLNPVEILKILYPLYFKDLIYKYSEKYSVDPLFVASMIREESKYDVRAVSWANAYGMMQIVPSTGRDIASKIGIKNFRTSMLHQPEINIHMGTWYTKYTFDLLDENYALVAGGYNCGPGRMKGWLDSDSSQGKLNDLDKFIENIPYRETRNHIKKVMDSYRIYKELYTESQT